MKRIRFFVETGFVNCVHEVVDSFPDDVTDEELDKYAKDLVWEFIHSSWREESTDGDE